jgi:diguanylate cyclase (GGDEF)-like protein
MKTVLSNQTLLPIKILFTKNVIKYLKKYEPENSTSIITEYEKMEKLREKRDLQIDSFNSHEMELQIKAAERQMQYEQTLKEKEMYQAMYNQDSTTGLFNRRGLNEAFIEMYKRRKPTSTIGLIILDIDCFKQYNDNYGHIKGDYAISALATALHENANTGFVPARFGGDEFVCLTENKTESDIKTYIEAIQKDLADKKIEHDYSTVDNPYVTASIGFCNEPFDESTSLEMLVYKSDIALYEAKKAGKNRIVESPNT